MRVNDKRYGRGQRQPTAAELAAVPQLILRDVRGQRDNRAGG
ncbi:MAG TPA: hypothetical protein VI172_14805 [Candidatus Dormibacteraeota bacterium]